MVRVKGVEPPRRKALEPKSSASTNSATLARRRRLYIKNKVKLICPLIFVIKNALFTIYSRNILVKITVSLKIFKKENDSFSCSFT